MPETHRIKTTPRRFVLCSRRRGSAFGVAEFVKNGLEYQKKRRNFCANFHQTPGNLNATILLSDTAHMFVQTAPRSIQWNGSCADCNFFVNNFCMFFLKKRKLQN